MMIREGLIRCIRYYQKRISPLRGPHCRFVPTCSQYAVEALERYGLLRGSLKAVWRILRCNPFGGSGYDPVDRSEAKPLETNRLSQAQHEDKESGSLPGERDRKECSHKCH